MKYSFQELHQQYEKLIPPKEEGLVVLWLFRQIKNEEIDEYFTYQNIKQAIQEVADLEVKGQSQTERILKSLLNYHIERPPNNIQSRYKLTEFARKFVSLVENKLESPYRNFPLRDSFQRYADFDADKIKSIEHLESWFVQGFHTTTRQTVVDHLESLKDDVANSIHALNEILYTEDESALDMAIRFAEEFKSFGDKANEISYTLKLGDDLERKLKRVMSYFDNQAEEYPHPQTEKQHAEYTKLRKQALRSVEIHREVSKFFSQVYEKLSQLRERILYASTKLNNLQEHFQYQSRFKINLNKFLQFTLEEGSYSLNELQMPSQFPRKKMYIESFKFIAIPYVDNFLPSSNPLVLSSHSIKHEERERQKISLELKRQERIVRLVKKYKKILEKQGALDFTRHFYKILEDEGDIELAIQVGYELVQFAANSQLHSITIDKFLKDELQKREVIIWQTTIRRLA